MAVFSGGGLHQLTRRPSYTLFPNPSLNGCEYGDVNRHSGDVNKVGAQRRWYLNDASDYSHGQEFFDSERGWGCGEGAAFEPLAPLGN